MPNVAKTTREGDGPASSPARPNPKSRGQSSTSDLKAAVGFHTVTPLAPTSSTPTTKEELASSKAAKRYRAANATNADAARQNAPR